MIYLSNNNNIIIIVIVVAELLDIILLPHQIKIIEQEKK